VGPKDFVVKIKFQYLAGTQTSVLDQGDGCPSTLALQPVQLSLVEIEPVSAE